MATQQCWPESTTGLIQKIDFQERACQQRGWVFCHYQGWRHVSNQHQSAMTHWDLHGAPDASSRPPEDCCHHNLPSKESNAIGENRDLKANPGLCMPCWHPHAVQLYVLQGCRVSISWQTLRSYSKTLNWCSSHVKLLLLRFWYRHLKMIQCVFVENYGNYGIQERHRWSNLFRIFGHQAESFEPRLLKWQKRRQHICGGAPTVTLQRTMKRSMPVVSTWFVNQNAEINWKILVKPLRSCVGAFIQHTMM